MQSVFRVTVWLHKGPIIFNFGLVFFSRGSLVLDWESWFFTRWVPGLNITICNNITVVTSTSVLSWSNWNLEGLVFDERGKLEVPGEKFLRAKERTNNKLYPHMARYWDLNPGHIGGRQVLSPLCLYHRSATVLRRLFLFRPVADQAFLGRGGGAEESDGLQR